MLKWKANLAQDSDGLYNAQQMINQLTQGLPLANESTVQLADTHLDENSDWSKINYNEYYLFDSLMGLNAPDKQSLIYDRGLTIRIGDNSEFIQLAITQDGIGVKYNNTNWSYLLNGSGGSGTSGNYVIDNKDGTVYFNGVTVTLATSKDVQSLTNLINLKQDKLTYNPADDSTVAHLSGANNFDTVPTVNNNPLLLASSLPSDLARTGQSNTFNSLQTFSQGIKTLQTGSYDDANSLVNEGLYFNTNLSIKNAAGSITAGFIQVISGYWEIIRQFMYSDLTNNLVYTRVSSDIGSTWSDWVRIITSDQVPSDLARTGQANTFTAAQTFSIAPVINDASTDKGDNQAATMADLKSVENSAWHNLTTTDVNGSFAVEILYQKMISEKKLRFIFIADYKQDKDLSNYNLAIDLSKIITKFQTPFGSTQRLSTISDHPGMNYDFNANNGSSLITCSNPITCSRGDSNGFATSFLTTRSNGVLNDRLSVDGFIS
jgi:hypothetical protein